MNNALKYIVGISIFVLTLFFITLALMSAGQRKQEMLLTGIDIENTSPQGHRFLEDEDLIALVELHQGRIEGRPFKNFDPRALEADLDQVSCIQKSQVYVDMEGVLHIQVMERVPFVRLETSHGGYYADCQGIVFPLQSHYSAWVPVIDGDLPIQNADSMSEPEQKWLQQLITLVASFQNKSKWKNRCTQVHISKEGWIILSLDGYSERFILGDSSDLEKKQHKIEQYISLIQPRREAGKPYKNVNVRYKGQIICQ